MTEIRFFRIREFASQAGLLGILLGLSLGLSSCGSSKCCPGGHQTGLTLPERPQSQGATVLVEAYEVLPRKFQAASTSQRLRELGFDSDSGRRDTTGVIRFRSKKADSSVANFHESRSEFNYFRKTAPEIKAGNTPDSKAGDTPDSAYRRMAREHLRKVLGEEKARLFSLTRMDRIRKGSIQDTIGRTIYFLGNFGMKIAKRHVLGNGYGARVGIGGDGLPMDFSFFDPELVQSDAIQVPTPAAVWDSLKRWERSDSRPSCLRYAKHPDLPYITHLSVKQIFPSFVQVPSETKQDPNSTSIPIPARRLAPRVTVMAYARFERPFVPAKDQIVFPIPDSLVIYFHFPCTPSAGDCWPEGRELALLPPLVGTEPPQRR